VVGATTALPDELVPGAGILSRIVTGSSLPVRSGSLRGLAIVGMDAGSLLPEAGRSLAPGARIVVEGADGEFAAELVRNGFELHLEQDGVVVASPSDRS